MSKMSTTSIYIPHIGWLDYPDGDDVVNFLREGWFEYREIAFLWLYLRGKDVVIDCGAHAGLFSVLASKILQQSGRVIAVEPSPDTAALLERNLAENEAGNAKIIQAAVYHQAGKIKLHLNEPGKAAYDSIYVGEKSARNLSVAAITLDKLLSDEEIRRVDFLKLDIEGAEIDALGGASESVKGGKLPVVMVEVTEANLRASGRGTDDLRAAFEAAGYRLCAFNPESLQLEDYPFDGPVWYDNLFACLDPAAVNKRLRTAGARNKRIAKDLLLRGQAAALIKDSGEASRKKEESARLLAEQMEATARGRLEQMQQLEALASGRLDQIAQLGAIAKTRLDQVRHAEAVREVLLEQWQAEVEARDALTEELRQAAAKSQQLEEARQTEVAAREALAEELGRMGGVARERLMLLRRSHLQHEIAERRINDYLLVRWPLRLAFKFRLAQRPVWLAERQKAAESEDVVRRYVAENPLEPEPAPASTGPQVAVLLCTYNPRKDLLAWSLESIARQRLDPSLYEVILIDNNSNPPVDLSQFRVAETMPIRVVREERQGLIFARLAGIAASTGPVIVFVDDDNYLDPDYLAKALEIARGNSEIGLFGGVAHGRLERQVPGWKQQLLPFLGVRDNGPEPVTSFEPCWGPWEPIGAGMVARRDVAEAYAAFVESNAASGGLGRKGNELMACEDSLFARVANQKGYACSYQPALSLEHFITKRRLSSRYLFRLIRGMGRSYVRLERVLGRGSGIQPLDFWQLPARLSYRFGREGVAGVFRWAWDLGYQAEARSEEPVKEGSGQLDAVQAP